MKYVALDFETANTSPVSACSVGVVRFEDHQMISTDAYLIQPPKQFGAFQACNIRVHGITREMVANAPSFDMLWSRLRADIENSVLVCHNAVFDTAVLLKTLMHYQIPIPRCRYVCTVKVSRKVWPELENHRLNTVSAALKIPLNHHEAGSDAFACGMILQHAMNQKNCTDVDALAEVIGMRIGVISPEGTISCSTAQKIVKNA